MKTKILIISNSLEIGGAEIYALTIANYLNRIGYKVYVASSGGKLVSKLENGIEHVQVRSDAKKLDAILNTANNINKIVAKHQIDLIHSNSVLTCLMAKLGTLFKGIPIINTVHSWGTNKNVISASLVNFCATKIIAVSESTANNYIKNGLNKKKVEIIYNGIDIKKFCKLPDEKLEYLRNELKINTNDFIITNIARMGETRKGHNTLIEAFKIIINQHPEVKLLLVGDGSLKESLIKKVKDYNIKKNVIFTGFRDDIPEILSISKILCLPSEWEGLPLSIAEAMACGVPVVASNISGIPEMIKDNETGYLVPPNAPEELACKIMNIINDQELLNNIQSNCIKTSHDKFNLDLQIQRLDNVYKSYLNLKGTPL